VTRRSPWRAKTVAEDPCRDGASNYGSRDERGPTVPGRPWPIEIEHSFVGVRLRRTLSPRLGDHRNDPCETLQLAVVRGLPFDKAHGRQDAESKCMNASNRCRAGTARPTSICNE
jgi:hypothetical protein